MKFKKSLITIATAALLVTGAAFAQQQVQHHRGDRVQFLATALDLTDAQKTAAQQIFADAKAQAQPIAAQLKQGHQDMVAAVKAGKSDAELTQIATTQGNLMGQLAAIHAKAFSKFYAELTPAQKDKASQLHDHFMGMMQHRWGNHLGNQAVPPKG